MNSSQSAWRDKLNKPDKNKNQYYHSKFGKRILERKYHKQVPNDLLESWNGGYRIEFADFVEWIAAGNANSDEHWAPISSSCSPCSSNVNFVGYLEHFSDDLVELARRLNGSSDLLPDSFKSINHHAATVPEKTDGLNGTSLEKKTTRSMFEGIKKETRQKLRKLYIKDYLMFNYKIPVWL